MEDDPEVVFSGRNQSTRDRSPLTPLDLEGGKEKGKVDADEEKVKHVEVGK